MRATGGPPAAVTNTLHHAGPVKDGCQVCAQCGCILQQGQFGAWPAGVPVLASATAQGKQLTVFEGITPGRFPQCAPS